MLNFNSILLSTEDPKKLADFYKEVLQKDPDWSDGTYYGFMAGNTFLSIGFHDKIKGRNSNPDRILLNFETSDVKGDFERIKKLGAKVIAEPYQMDKDSGWIATLADPDGNYFQLMPPWKEEN